MRCVHDLHVKALLKPPGVHDFIFIYNVMNVVNVVMFYLVIISDTINKFITGDNKDLLN